MNTFFDLVRQRRSHRKFTNEPVAQADIEKIVKTALMAPAGKRANPWEFIVVTDAEVRNRLSTCKPAGGAFVKDAPVAIVVVGDSSKSDVWTEDCSIAAIYLQLAAEALGLGSCWCQVRLRSSINEGRMAADEVRDILSLPDNYQVECIISIGHKAEERSPFDESRLQIEKIHYGKF